MVTKEKPKTGMYENVQNQFNKAADLMKLNPNVRKILSITNTEIVVNFPVKMDNGEVEVLKGTVFNTTMLLVHTKEGCVFTLQ